MDYDKEINNVAGETLALQSILVAVLSRVVHHDPRLEMVLRDGFDTAASFVEDRAIAHGRSVPPEHLTHALRVVEELKVATFGKPKRPQG